ncbi:NAD(P)(+)--arginine ADP-ribosyltransferase 2-like isoform X2 [Carcharodon carcharias]|nr:NAD(P)(+)--arginine ADP-ribosyltransferase 2-like isoform X2 [Carcharodon carcharias]XP_041029951.1 NAD(P)(+)--arginine ADP-ribosyltransferase 2-like isoform X2 [Carcharodon carcharias]XP_041029952.1 NAD(P)(+)--arginine ADP-ribosyltransferase 2-like isoform X2 [Carcharodon carcharias]XP_041029953.1 NAD(P)(+)--arginine ADP-ribosyltransferase 2-like isoform X2 [Carcharodon carcharias]
MVGNGLDMEENSAAYWFPRSEDWDNLAIECLNEELQKNKTFMNVSDLARKFWNGRTIPHGLRKEHMIVVTMYTHHGSLYKAFNDEVQKYGNITKYNSEFKLKAFHYLLTIALQALRDHSKYLHLYRGLNVPKFGRRGQEMRFGRFTSTSLNRTVAEGYGNRTLFVLNTTYGVKIRNYSFFEGEDEILIPPYEKFEIVKAESSGGNCIFTLRSRGYEGVEVGLERDGNDCLRVYRKTLPWWVWFLIVLAILVTLGGLGTFLYKCCCQE